MHRLVRDAKATQQFCRHKTYWYFFSQGSLWLGERKTSFTIPHPCPTPDALGVAVGKERTCWPLRRSRIILLLADGTTITDIAATVGMSRRHVYKWIYRFMQDGVEGLTDRPAGADGISRVRPDLQDEDDTDIIF